MAFICEGRELGDFRVGNAVCWQAILFLVGKGGDRRCVDLEGRLEV